MPSCRLCGVYFPNWLGIEGKPRNLRSRKYCVECSPWGRHKTRKFERPPAPALERKRCPKCGEEKPIDGFYLLPGGRRSHVWVQGVQQQRSESALPRGAARCAYALQRRQPPMCLLWPTNSRV